MKNRSMLGFFLIAVLLASFGTLSGCKSTCGAKQAHHQKCACPNCKADHKNKEDGSCGCGAIKHSGSSCSECTSCGGN